MNTSSFLYQIPFVQQPFFNFPNYSQSNSMFVFNPYFSFDQTQVMPQESYGINLPILAKYPENSDFQDTKLQTDSSNKSEEIKQKRIRKSKGPKKYKIERLRDDKGRYSGVFKHETSLKYKQNPKRNVLTNIANQLLSFSSSRSKSYSTLRMIAPHLTEEEVSNFYTFVSDIRQRTDYYLNIAKMDQIWNPSTLDSSQDVLRNRKLFRQLSYEYLNNIVRLSILSSLKIKSPFKIYHIKATKTLLQVLTLRNKN